MSLKKKKCFLIKECRMDRLQAEKGEFPNPNDEGYSESYTGNE